LFPILPLGVHALIETDDWFSSSQRVGRLTDDAAANLLYMQLGTSSARADAIGPKIADNARIVDQQPRILNILKARTRTALI